METIGELINLLIRRGVEIYSSSATGAVVNRESLSENAPMMSGVSYHPGADGWTTTLKLTSRARMERRGDSVVVSGLCKHGTRVTVKSFDFSDEDRISAAYNAILASAEDVAFCHCR